MSIHEYKKVSINEIKMALEKNVDAVYKRESVLERCKHLMEDNQNPLNMLEEQGYSDVVADAISLADGSINKSRFINRIKRNDSLISVYFLSMTQAKYQRYKIVEALDVAIDRFIGKECIVNGFSIINQDILHEGELIEAGVVDKPIREAQIIQAINVCIDFINTEQGRAQLEKVKKSLDVELDNFKEKELMDFYINNDQGTESDLISNYTEGELRTFEEEHKVEISRS